jgi:hypothetical protein
MALQTSVQLAVETDLTRTDGLASATATAPWSYGFQWPDGTGANTANRLYQGRRTINASSNEDLDLAAVLTDSYGVAITFARIRAVIVKAAAGNTNNVVVGGAASNAFVGPFGAATHTVAIPPDGIFMAVAPGTTGWAVTAGTGDLLRVANSGAGTSVTYDIFLIGASA